MILQAVSIRGDTVAVMGLVISQTQHSLMSMQIAVGIQLAAKTSTTRLHFQGCKTTQLPEKSLLLGTHQTCPIPTFWPTLRTTLRGALLFVDLPRTQYPNTSIGAIAVMPLAFSQNQEGCPAGEGCLWGSACLIQGGWGTSQTTTSKRRRYITYCTKPLGNLSTTIRHPMGKFHSSSFIRVGDLPYSQAPWPKYVSC